MRQRQVCVRRQKTAKREQEGKPQLKGKPTNEQGKHAATAYVIRCLCNGASAEAGFQKSSNNEWECASMR
jgi:hypothetical protein